MIAKGTLHNNGAKLATYMTTGKEGERAELWQLRGFAAAAIGDAFRSVHVMAEATQCTKPFFHVQVRNPEGEELTRPQWERVADRIEAKLGYSGQPRAIAFHRDEASGHEHMHLAWSRIDDESMKLRPLPFFKLRLKEVSRELEQELGLTPVRNVREGTVMAPGRSEEEQARRLDVDLQDVRKTIRTCYDHADSGKAFVAALAEHGLMLARGERRDFVVIDPAGGLHALGKRVLGTTAAQTRERLAD
ncbi:MAG: relaxase/mobilization nuclease domain-containing protein, partial [Sphingomonadales bacterium]|nr:relaxase/mobilization nuclease domain-containing protein [Sphingomonadales bacterium]